MANPTTNYGFVLPTPTDLVTDLPADFDVALQGVDTRLKALQPGTTAGDLMYASSTANTNVRLGIGSTNQVLAVVGGVPAWTTTADVTPLTTKGDLFTFSTVDARLAVGTNGQVLTADSSEATGLKYATPAGSSFVGASAYRAASQTISNSTETALTFDNENYDTNSFHDNVTNNTRMTIPAGKAGKYLITANTIFTNNATGQRIVFVYVNATNVTFTGPAIGGSASIDLGLTTTYVADLLVGDIVEVRAFQNSGGNLAILANTARSSFQVSYLGA